MLKEKFSNKRKKKQGQVQDSEQDEIDTKRRNYRCKFIQFIYEQHKN